MFVSSRVNFILLSLVCSSYNSIYSSCPINFRRMAWVPWTIGKRSKFRLPTWPSLGGMRNQGLWFFLWCLLEWSSHCPKVSIQQGYSFCSVGKTEELLLRLYGPHPLALSSISLALSLEYTVSFLWLPSLATLPFLHISGCWCKKHPNL